MVPTVMADVNTEAELWGESLEDFLHQACQAEAKEDYEAANVLFRRALFYEAKLRPEVTNAKAYVNAVGPAYKGQVSASAFSPGQ